MYRFIFFLLCKLVFASKPKSQVIRTKKKQTKIFAWEKEKEEKKTKKRARIIFKKKKKERRIKQWNFNKHRKRMRWILLRPKRKAVSIYTCSGKTMKKKERKKERKIFFTWLDSIICYVTQECRQTSYVYFFQVYIYVYKIMLFYTTFSTCSFVGVIYFWRVK